MVNDTTRFLHMILTQTERESSGTQHPDEPTSENHPQHELK